MFADRGTHARRWRARRRPDDTGSMPLALLVTLVGVTLSASLAGVVVGQIRDSQRAADRVAAVAAAQAGLDAGLARIRAAVSGVTGVLSALPCTRITPPAGSGQPDYSTTIGYFLVDPSGMVNTLAPIGELTNLSRLTDPAAGMTVANLLASLGRPVNGTVNTAAITTAVQSAVGCVSGALQQVPLFGLLRSTGTAGTTTRTLYATYTFRTTQETIPGGHVVIAGTNGALCLGDRDDPAVGHSVWAVPCTGAEDRVKFVYPKNLSLSLSKSRTTRAAGTPYGLCITSPVVPAVDAAVSFQACTATKTARQQWSYEVNAQTYYGTTDGVQSNGFCLSQQSPGAVNTPIVLKKGGGFCGSAGVTGRAFVPDASAGAGAAGIGTGQLVNYAEYGRCLDLTNEDPRGSWFTDRGQAPALITYPCKQNFTSTVYWNHKWTGPTIPTGDYRATGQIYTVPTSGSYTGQLFCLKSPGISGGYVWVGLCSAGGTNLQWTVYAAAPQFADSYQVVDSYGHCLEAAGSLGAAYQYSGWSEVIATTCDGSPIQKWNAPRSLNPGPLSGVQER